MIDATKASAARSILYSVASGLLVLLIWWGIVATGLISQAVLPTPGSVAKTGWEELRTGSLGNHVLASGARLLAGFALGSSIGVMLGLILGWSTIARQALGPIIEILRPIPPLAWIPLGLIWFGIGEGSKIFLIALTCSFPVLVATFKGVEQIEVSLIRAAQSLDVTPVGMLFAVVLPAALPDVMTGLRLGWSLGITVLVGAEMIAAPSGVGFLVMDGMNNGRFDQVILGILVLGTLSVATDALFMRAIHGRLLRWHAGLDKAAG